MDLGRPALPPATWSRTSLGVRLVSVRMHDDPLEPNEAWYTTEDVIVVDGPDARATAARLIADADAARMDLASEIDDAVRRAALALLRDLDPELWGRVAAVTDEAPKASVKSEPLDADL